MRTPLVEGARDVVEGHLSENGHEAAQKGQQGSNQSSESGGADGTSELHGKPVQTAYFSVATAAGALGGVSPFVSTIAKGGPELLIFAIAFLVLVVLLDIGVKWVDQHLKEKITLPRAAFAGVTLVALVLGAGTGYAFSHHSGSGTPQVGSSASATPIAPTTAAPTTAPATTAAPCPKPLTITSPASGTHIVGHVGVQLGIDACGLTSGQTAWLFDYESGTYGLDGDGGPIVSSNQTFTFEDTPVGSPGDTNEPVQLTLVLADSACNTALNGMDLQNNQPAALPASCQIASQVEVIETY